VLKTGNLEIKLSSFFFQQNNTLNLDLTAKVLLGDPTIDQRDVGRFKSKCMFVQFVQ
jgi:hypothetical protein